MDERQFWVGTYTGARGGGRGIYRVRRGPGGALESLGVAVEAVSPSYLAVHPRGNVLYAVGEDTDHGAILAFAVENDGSLRLLGERPVPADPCHLAVQPDGGHLLAASYTAGTVAAQPLDPAGGFTGEPFLVRGHGSGPRADRQEGPHAHAVLSAPDGTVLAIDLGADLVRAFRAEPGGLRHVADTALPAGYGPRHLVLHPSGHLYVLTELEPRLLVLTPGRSYADLSVTAESPSLAGDSGPDPQGAAIKLTADGRHLYTSTRNTDVITTHRVTADGAGLVPVADVPSGGRGPRDLYLDGGRMLVANQLSDGVQDFRLDPVTGVPDPAGDPVQVPAPVCVVPVTGD